MKKHTKKFYLLKGEVWPYDIFVALGSTKKEMFTYLDEKFVNPLKQEDKDKLIDHDSRGQAIQCSNNSLILWLKEFPTTPEYFGHLAHEIFHVADMILDKAGLSLTQQSDEAWAYLIDWITKSIYKEFNLLKRDNEKK